MGRDDIFLQSIGKVVPLKKNKNFKQIKKVIIKIKNKTNEETKIETTTSEKIINKKTNFQIESIPVEKKISEEKDVYNEGSREPNQNKVQATRIKPDLTTVLPLNFELGAENYVQNEEQNNRSVWKNIKK